MAVREILGNIADCAANVGEALIDRSVVANATEVLHSEKHDVQRKALTKLISDVGLLGARGEEDGSCGSAVIV